MPIYEHYGKKYNIPDDKASAFESKYPNASVLYNNEGTEYNIPVSKSEAFRKKYPNAVYSVYEPKSEKTEEQNVLDIARQANQELTDTLEQPTFGAEDLGIKPEASESIANATPNILPSDQANIAKQELERQEELEQYKKIAVQNEDRISNLQQKAQRQQDIDTGVRKALQSKLGRFNPLSWILDFVNPTEKNYELAQRELQRENKLINAATSGDAGAIKALEDVFTDLGTYDMGFGDMTNAFSMNRIKTKLEAGEQLDDSEKELLQATMSNQYAQSALDGELSNMYRFGKIAGESAPYMVDFLLSSGITDMIRGGSKLAAKTITKAGIEGTKKAAMVKMLGVSADNIAKAALITNTLQLPSTIAAVQQGKVGTPALDEQGNVVFEGEQGSLEALYKGEAASIIENFTEFTGGQMMGAGKWLGGKMSQGLEKVGLSKINNLVHGLKSTEFAKSFAQGLEKVGVHGLTEEILEEELAIPLNALFLQEYPKSMGEFWRNQLDIFGGIGLSVGMMKGAGYTIGGVVSGINKGKQYISYKKKMSSIDRNAQNDFENNSAAWEQIKQSLDGATNDNINDVVETILQSGNEDGTPFTDEQKEDIKDYYSTLIEFRGFNIGTVAAERDGVSDPVENGTDKAFIEGYNATDAQGRNDAKLALELAEEKVRSMPNIASEDLDDEKLLMFDIKYAKDWTYDDKQAIIDYLNAKYRFEGMTQRITDDINDKIAESDRLIDKRTDLAGDVVEVKDLGGKTMYVRSGHVITNDDGSVDEEYSDPSIVVIDEDNKLSMISPAYLSSVVQTTKAEELKAKTAEAIRKEGVAKGSAEIDGQVQLVPGQSYNVLDAGNNAGTVKILSLDDLNGNITVDFNGMETTLMASDLQAMVDAYNKQRVAAEQAEATEQAAAEEAEEQAQQVEEGKIPYNLGDRVQLKLGDDLVVGAEITSLPDEKGNNEVFVTFDEPINGKVRTSYPVDDFMSMIVKEQPTTETSSELPPLTGAEDVSQIDLTDKELTTEASQNEQSTEAKQKDVTPTSQSKVDELYGMDMNAEEVSGIISANIEAAKKEVEKISKKQPSSSKYTDPAKYIEARNKWRSEHDAAQANLDFWTDADRINKERNKPVFEEPEIDLIPSNEIVDANDFIASLLGTSIFITPESYRKETGYKGEEQKKMVGVIRSKEKGGVSIERASEIIFDGNEDELKGYGFTGDQMDVRNTIIEILQDGNPRGYVKRRNEERNRRLKEAAEEERQEAAFDQYHMTAEEADEYEKSIDAALLDYYKDFDEDYFYSQLADEENERDTETESTEDATSDKDVQGEQHTESEGTEPTTEGKREGAVSSGGEVHADDTGTTEPVLKPKKKAKPKKKSLLDIVKAYIKGIMHLNGREIITNGTILISTDSEYDKSLEGKVTDKKGNVTEKEDYPNISLVTEQDFKDIATINVSNFIKQVRDVAEKLKREFAEDYQYNFIRSAIRFKLNGKDYGMLMSNAIQLADALEKFNNVSSVGISKKGFLKISSDNTDIYIIAYEGNNSNTSYTVENYYPIESVFENVKTTEDVADVEITEEQIKATNLDQITKDGAISYIKGNRNFATAIAYQQAVNYVRNTTEATEPSSTATDGTLMDASIPSDERGTSGQEGGTTERVADETGKEGSERTEPVPSTQSAENKSSVPSGTTSDAEASTEEPATDGVSAKRGKSKRSSRPSRGGNDVSKPRGKRSSRKFIAKDERGEFATERNALADELDDLYSDFIKAGKDTLSVSVLPFNAKQLEILGKILIVGVKYGYTYIKEGIYKFSEWRDKMHEKFYAPCTDVMKFTEAQVDEFINDMWNYPFTIDGETRLLSEWASILEQQSLRAVARQGLSQKYAAQQAAEGIPVKVGSMKNIVETLPYLLPQQQEDVRRAETQFFDPSHQDREHGYGKGYLFTNGTGTGKTYTGLGIIKRFVKQGKGRILILTPSQAKVNDWTQDGKNLGLNITPLESTKDKGSGVVITTFANLRTNKALMEDTFDLIVYDESHRIMENKAGEETIGAQQHYMLSNKNVDQAIKRLQVNDPFFIKYNELSQQLKDLDNKIENVKNEIRRGENQEGVEVLASLESTKKEIQSEWDEMRKHLKEEEERLKPKAEEAVKNTKVVFLSATPFNTVESLAYTEGYIFSYPEENKNTIGSYNHRSPKEDFLERNFGAGYRFRYGRIEKHVENPEALSQQEIQFSDYLENELGTKSGRIIDSEYDYSRDFPAVTLNMAPLFNKALQEVFDPESDFHILSDAFHDIFFDYNYSTALFETMKISAIIPRIKEHLAMGRKVVIFHRRKASKFPMQPPFMSALAQARAMASEINTSSETGAAEKKAYMDAIAEFQKKYERLMEYEQKLNYSMPREQIAEVFGPENVLYFSGSESKKTKNEAIKQFNDDDSGKNIIVIQEASGKEGISLHDTTGKHQRVLISLALPQSPITALQIEGRIYRIGNKSNAIFEYPLLGLDLETTLFGQKFNQQVSTTENLALGSKARNLRQSFAEGVLTNSGDVPLDKQGVGGKAFDNEGKEDADAFDKAILDYYGTQKLKGKRNERAGVDYFPTPEPVGFKMAEWGMIEDGDDVLEPSAGHGAIARYVPRTNALTAVEPSNDLFATLQLRAGGQGRKFVNSTFESLDVKNKYDVVLMNPPYGTAGRLAVDHLDKAFSHLNEGGRIVAILPVGSAEKKLEKWYEEHPSAVEVGEIRMPAVTFGRAGTSVMTKIVVIDKITREETRAKAPYGVHIDLSDLDNIDKENGLFEAIRDINMPRRTIDQTFIDIKNAKKTKKDFADNKAVYRNFVTENGITAAASGCIPFNASWEDLKGNGAIRTYQSFQNEHDYIERKANSQGGLSKYDDNRLEYYSTVLKAIRNVSGISEKELSEGEVIEEERGPIATEKTTEEKPTYEKKATDIYSYSQEEHSRTGETMHMVKPKRGVSLPTDQYKKFSELAKENNGYWNRTKKGFHFKTKEDAEKFINSSIQTTDSGIRYRKVTENENNRFTPSYKLDPQKTYHIRQASDMKSDMQRGWSSWNFGNVVYEGSKNDFIDWINRYKEGGASMDLVTGDDWVNEDAEVFAEGDSVFLNTDSESYEFRELYPEHWVVVDNTNAPGGLSSYEIDTKNMESVQDILDLYNSKKSYYDGTGDGEYFEADNSRVVYESEPDKYGTRMYIIEEGAEEPDNIVSKNESLQRKSKPTEEYPRGKFTSKEREERIAFVKREIERAKKRVRDMADYFHVKVRIVENLDELTDEQKDAKGWYDVNTGEITIVIPNHESVYDVMQSMLHEAVAHHGLRKLFGKHFDTFIANVYNSASREIKAKIDALAKEEGLSRAVATEEYMASLAEDTNFRNPMNTTWWGKIKEFFLKMLASVGMKIPTLTDNELRYVLWRSYMNLSQPGYYKSPIGVAEDVVMQDRLEVGNYGEQEYNRLFRFIGEKGAANLDRYEEGIRRMDNLEVARQMEEGGKTPKEIKMATGWERGADGKWRYEMRDFEKFSKWGNAEWIKEHPDVERYNELLHKQNAHILLDEEPLTEKEQNELDKLGKTAGQYNQNMTIKNPNALRLRDFVSDKSLESAYPEIPKMRVMFEDNPNYNGMFDGVSFHINKNIMNKNAMYIKSVFAHEVQHAIQDAEGFSQGGTGSYAREQIGDILSRYRINREDIDRMKDDVESIEKYIYKAEQSKKWFKNPNSFLKSQESFEQLRDKVQNGQKLAEKYYWDVMNFVNSSYYEQFMKKYNDDWYSDYKKLKLDFSGVENAEDEEWMRLTTNYAKEGRFLDDTLSMLRKHKNDMEKYIRQYKKDFMDEKDVSYYDRIKNMYDTKTDEELYWALAGEVESRNVQFRLGLTTEQRRATLAEETEDIAREDQIFLENAMDSASMDENILFRKKRPTGRAYREYNEAIRPTKSWKKFFNNIREGYVDGLRSIKKFQDAVLKETGNKLEDFENTYNAITAMSSINTPELKLFGVKYMDPINKEIAKICKTPAERIDLNIYLIAKHGLERNEYYRRKEANEYADEQIDEAKMTAELEKEGYDEYEISEAIAKARKEKFNEKYEELQSKDYAGLTELTQTDETEKNEEFTERAEAIVKEYESKHDTAPLWDKINAATKKTLRTDYESGNLTYENYELIRGMYKNYVPLRGWAKDEAAKEYEYRESDNKNVFSAAVMKTRGRVSQADDVISHIGNVGEGTIVMANRNLMKQHLLNFVENNPTDLATVSKQWYVRDSVDSEVWREAYPEFPKDVSFEKSRQILEDFEEEMKKMKAEGLAKQKKGKLNTGLHMRKKEKPEHMVSVMLNGKKINIFINGNPRAAQAVNGMLNPDNYDNRVARTLNWFKRTIAELLTSKNIAFVYANLARDVIWSRVAIDVKENSQYSNRFRKNLNQILFGRSPRSLIKGEEKLFKEPRGLRRRMVVDRIMSLIDKYNKDELDMGVDVERYFYEFVSNGGETGFTAIHSVDDYKKMMDRYIKDANRKDGVVKWTKEQWRGLWDAIEKYNRAAEDVSRFATYITSRQEGRSIERSVNDAKEVTVNFNVKGSGEFGAKYFNWAYVFFNAAVQAINTFFKTARKNPLKMSKKLAKWAMYGALFSLYSISISGDGDDNNPYFDLPEWERYNNICIYVPFSGNIFIKIPISHELRPFYAMGVMSLETLVGQKEYGEAIEDVGKSAITNFLPLDYTGNGGNALITSTPTVFQPLVQIKENVDFFGKPIYRKTPFNENAPEWTKSYNGTSPILIGGAKALNALSGGNEVKAGWADINPAKVEHIIESYFGGPGKLINKTANSFSMLWDEEARQWKNVPILSGFVSGADPRFAGSDTNSKYFELTDEYKEMQRIMNGYKKLMKEGEEGYAELYSDFMKENAARYSVMKKFIDNIGNLRKVSDMISNEEDKKPINDAITNMKVEMIETLDKMDNN